jgi:hypothetical protein
MSDNKVSPDEFLDNSKEYNPNAADESRERLRKLSDSTNMSASEYAQHLRNIRMIYRD